MEKRKERSPEEEARQAKVQELLPCPERGTGGEKGGVHRHRSIIHVQLAVCFEDRLPD